MHYLNLINIKNNGGLVIPSADVVKIFNKNAKGISMPTLPVEFYAPAKNNMNILVAVGLFPVVCALYPGTSYR